MRESEATLTQVQRLLDQLGVHHRARGDGELQVEAGSTAVYITVDENDGHSVVCLLAPLLDDVEPPGEQLAELLALNARLNSGKFSWHPEQRMLSLDCELLGDSIDLAELDVALRTVAGNADMLDDRLRARLGGRRLHVDV